MPVDQGTLFVAGGICACALAFSMLNVWANNRSDRFLATWLVSLLLLGTGVAIYGTSTLEDTVALVLAFSLQACGFVAIYLTSRELAGRRTPWPVIAVLVILTGAAPITSLLVGYTVVGWATFNLVLFCLVLACAWQYWQAREEAPGPITGLVLLYCLTATSFLLCAVALIMDGGTDLASLPVNWAESFNAITCIVAVTGVGALSLGLNQSRAAYRSEKAARTDQLTGMSNRRALFVDEGSRTLAAETVVIVFDLDHFKSINDRHGHAAGDAVLKTFAELMLARISPSDMAARLGGEEFVLIMPRISVADAVVLADELRRELARASIKGPKGPVRVTTSVGLAVCKDSEPLETVLVRADAALYRAKDEGRNRLAIHPLAAA